MIIHSPIRVTDKKFTEYTAKINFLKKDRTLVFRIDSRYDHLLTDLSDPFLIALLLPAMRNGEGIEVRGKVSDKLLKNMQSTVQDALCSVILYLKKVPITATEVITGSPAGSKNVLCGMSGGVDSFASFEDYYLRPKTSTKITHFLFNNQANLYESTPQKIDNVRKLLRKYNAPLIQTWSNSHMFREQYGLKVSVDSSYAMDNVAIAHLLGGESNTFLISDGGSANPRGTESTFVDNFKK
jgi:hypothetical protein